MGPCACKRFGCFKRALSDGWCADHHEVLTIMADGRPGSAYADVLVAERDEARAEKAEGERDQWLEAANANSRYARAWQEWAANVLAAIGKQPDGGQHGDGPARGIIEAEVKTLTSELGEARAERVMFCALVESLTSERDEARAERDSLAETRGALTANLNALTIALGESRSELAEARRMLAEAIDERDAYRDGRYAGPWQPVADHHNGEGYSRAGAAFVGRRRDGRYEWNCAGFRSDLAETAAGAKAAADAHLVAAGWWLEGGPHKAGEAK